MCGTMSGRKPGDLPAQNNADAGGLRNRSQGTRPLDTQDGNAMPAGATLAGQVENNAFQSAHVEKQYRVANV